jgi:hypothetical protein
MFYVRLGEFQENIMGKTHSKPLNNNPKLLLIANINPKLLLIANLRKKN